MELKVKNTNQNRTENAPRQPQLFLGGGGLSLLLATNSSLLDTGLPDGHVQRSARRAGAWAGRPRRKEAIPLAWLLG